MQLRRDTGASDKIADAVRSGICGEQPADPDGRNGQRPEMEQTEHLPPIHPAEIAGGQQQAKDNDHHAGDDLSGPLPR